MESTELVFTVLYGLLAMGFIAPPNEFVSAGLTIQYLFSSYLGSEAVNFVNYHIKRTAATVIAHSLLPLGYYVGLGFFVPSYKLYEPWKVSLAWKLFLAVCLILPICAAALVYHWSRKKWANHPISRTLQYLAPTGSSWHAVASSINIEFRRIDKFMTGVHGRMVILTDSWVMQTTTYSVDVAHQSGVVLHLEGAEQHQISHESQSGAQYLSIKVTSTNHNIPPFHIRLNALEYGDLKEKLRTPIHNARNVVIQQTLSDRFLEAFREQVAANSVYRLPPDTDLEPCIGCMQKTANIKLQKLCDNLNEGDCVQCYCRPMWCLECMGKWFVSRQNQQEPDTWLSSKCPCPTCRSKFCMLDVCLIT